MIREVGVLGLGRAAGLYDGMIGEIRSPIILLLLIKKTTSSGTQEKRALREIRRSCRMAKSRLRE